MNTCIIKKIAAGLALVLVCLFPNSCTDDFDNINTNPGSLETVDPEALFYKAQTYMQTAGELWNDTYACKLRWLQYCSNIWGYATTNFTYFGSSIGSGLYSSYNSVGSYITNANYLAEKAGKNDIYSDMMQMGRILVIAKGIQTTDMHGSLAYKEAWKVRAGEESIEYLTPVFDDQETLFKTWDSELVECINKLKNSPSNAKSMGSYDRAYGGNTSQWVKAANALRLRIAIRLLNRLPDLAKEIAAEVLATSNSTYLPSSIDDSFILWHANNYTTYNKGDWHSVYDMDCAAAPFMDYLKKYNDPRKGIFFQINNLTDENIAAYNAQADNQKVGGDISANMTRWEGGTVSYDHRSADEPYLNRYLYSNPAISMRAMNRTQTQLWKGTGYDGTGTGGNFAPILSYADFCLMASEFVHTTDIISSRTAEQWYLEGIRASLKQWDQLADYCNTYDYEAITDQDILDFISQPGIAWDNTKAIEQIYCQFYVESFKNTNETWAMWKRTGYPNKSTTIIHFDPVMITGIEQNIPRKVRFSYPMEGTTNYDNIKARLDGMASYPEFININNEFGHLWWEN